MGIGDAIGSGMKKNMENQMQFQKELILKQRQMQMANHIAMGRLRFEYFQYFYFTMIPIMLLGFYKKRNPSLMIPIIPMSFAYAYQYDLLHGSMFLRSRIIADQLIT
jgi:hypothetical protein